MDQIEIYIILLAIIALVGVLFSKSPIPTPLVLVITGMVLSLFSFFPHIELNPSIVLNIFLPLLLYQISTFSSWKEVKKNFRPIALLSVGHVLFITFLVAITIHYLLPQLGWPLAFVLGAVVSPPDDVAIVAIAEKIHMPNRVVTILEGEGMLNDATALTLFKFALLAVATHQFFVWHAVTSFFLVVIGETLYGLMLGFLIGELRLRIHDSLIHMIVSFITPFLAYLPAERLGGSGVLATVITGFVIGNVYAARFSPEFRLLSRAIWPTLAFILQSILFLFVGLNMRHILESIALMRSHSLLIYTSAIIAVVIIGRFIWVYPAAYIPRFLFSSIRKKDPYPPWQYVFIVAFAGMRGSISLAAVLALPFITSTFDNINTRDLLIFIVFWVVIATLVLQGATLPWLLKIIGVQRYGQKEKFAEHVAEFRARLKLVHVVLKWLDEYKNLSADNPVLQEEIKLRMREYKRLKRQLRERIKNHTDDIDDHDEQAELHEMTFFNKQIIQIEKEALLQLWRSEKIGYYLRNKLLDELDHRSKHLLG